MRCMLRGKAGELRTNERAGSPSHRAARRMGGAQLRINGLERAIGFLALLGLRSHAG
jgi:hypothetical protein